MQPHLCMKLLIYSHKFKEVDIPHIKELLDTCILHEMELYFYKSYHDELVKHQLIDAAQSTFSGYTDIQRIAPGMMVTLGGDGTILRAILHIRDTNVPILGINLGRLGFLSNVEKTKIKDTIALVLSGQYTLEQRSMLSLESNMQIFGETPFCLNDFTLHKRDTSSMVTIHTYIDGNFLNSYWADGIVVSTPTGSTGYSLSVGGPIVFPDSGNFVIAPVAPHNLNVRPVVISDTSTIQFEIEGRSENFLCTLDSRYETITAEHKLSVRKCDFKINLVRPASGTFMKTIRDKLLWGRDHRN